MTHEFTLENWKSEEGIYRLDYKTEHEEKILIQVFKLTSEENAYSLTNEQDVVIMRMKNTITLATRDPFSGYIIAKF